MTIWNGGGLEYLLDTEWDVGDLNVGMVAPRCLLWMFLVYTSSITYMFLNNFPMQSEWLCQNYRFSYAISTIFGVALL